MFAHFVQLTMRVLAISSVKVVCIINHVEVLAEHKESLWFCAHQPQPCWKSSDQWNPILSFFSFFFPQFLSIRASACKILEYTVLYKDQKDTLRVSEIQFRHSSFQNFFSELGLAAAVNEMRQIQEEDPRNRHWLKTLRNRLLLRMSVN